MKKVLATLIVIVLMFTVLAGCSKDSGNGSTTSPTGGGSGTSGGIAKDDIKLGIILFGTTDDGGWSESHWVAFEKTFKELGLRDDQWNLIQQVGYGPEAASALEQLVDEGCNMIFASSSGHQEYMYDMAIRYPNILFHQFENLRPAPNLSSFSVRDYEAIFMIGYVAAKMSASDDLGFVAAMPQSSVVRAINAWAKGAQYANPNATVSVVWVNSWFDPAVDKASAEALIADGKTVLGYHGSSSAVMQAAGDAGVYATGFHIDMQHYAPNAVITSFVWNWSPIYTIAIQNAIDGKWTNETAFLGIDYNCATIAPFNTALVPQSVIDEVAQVESKLRSGEIQVFQTPVIDNQGNTILPAGGSFTDDELINMLFLIDNVIGSM